MSVATPDDSRAILDVAIEAARAGSQHLTLDGAARRPYVSKQTAAPDPVTADDRAVERVIRQVLDDSAYRGVVVGEELGRTGQGPIEWHVDPIDGTQNYISQLPFFSISIAAVLGGEVVAGVVLDPVRDELFTAHGDVAAVGGRELASIGAERDEDAVLASAYPDMRRGAVDPHSSEWTHWAAVHERFRCVRRLGSAALELAYVADGRIDVMHTMCVGSWDLAAGWLLVKNAGGTFKRITSSDDGLPAWSGPECIATSGSYDLTQSSLDHLLHQ